MLKRFSVTLLVLFALIAVAYSQSMKKAPTVKAATDGGGSNASLVKRGKYLVIAGGCSDCHSPKKFTAQGPVPDSSKLLSGAPADSKTPAVPSNVLTPTGWAAMCTADMTTWAGPWGVSYAANITPDEATGIGNWTEGAFIQTMRTGKHLGAGRELLPPMPWQALGALTDQDLKAIFAYLKSIKPIHNEVPQPIDPTGH